MFPQGMIVANSHASQKFVVNGRVVNDSSRVKHMEAKRGMDSPKWIGHTTHHNHDLENIGLAGKRDRFLLDVDQGIDTFRDMMNPGDYHRYRHSTLKKKGTPQQLHKKIRGLPLLKAPMKYRLEGMEESQKVERQRKAKRTGKGAKRKVAKRTGKEGAKRTGKVEKRQRKKGKGGGKGKTKTLKKNN